MTLTCPTINLSGNANVSNGLDVTGIITCSSTLDIEGNIEMANAQKIQWVNADTYVSGGDTSLTIDCDDNLNIYCDTKMSVFTPLTEYYTNVAGGKDFNIKSTNTTDGYTKLNLISRNGAAYGDIWQLKNDTQKLQFFTDKTTRRERPTTLSLSLLVIQIHYCLKQMSVVTLMLRMKLILKI